MSGLSLSCVIQLCWSAGTEVVQVLCSLSTGAWQQYSAEKAAAYHSSS